VNNRVYTMLRQSTLGELFYVLPNNEYAFRKGFSKLTPINKLFKQSPDACIDYLKSLYTDANIVDRAIIKQLVKELKLSLTR